MSGDVQPRKRKDRKRKKDELSIEEPRGTAAVLGEGDLLIHSQHDHGTGGHWCAKVIFFSLLVLLTGLIGLIILEKRGLTDLEASSVASRYSEVFDGWLEDAPEDHHHDEHTLELTHPVEEDHEDGPGSDEDQEVELEDLEHEVDDVSKNVSHLVSPEDESEELDEDEEDFVFRHPYTDEDISIKDVHFGDEYETPKPDDDEEDSDRYKIDPFGYIGLEPDFDDEKNEDVSHHAGSSGLKLSEEDPYEELEDSEMDPVLHYESLLEEEEYERQQEQLRKEQEEASHLWLKLGVGAALLLATHAVVRRATRRDNEENVEPAPDDIPTIIDRRMTLLLEEPPISEYKKVAPLESMKVRQTEPPVFRAPPPPPVEEESEEDIELEEEEVIIMKKSPVFKQAAADNELYSEDDIEEEEEHLPATVSATKVPVVSDDRESESGGEEFPDDVEIIEDEEQLEDEDVEEEQEEDEISDVDDEELLTRLEAKYGRLPEPERFGTKHKDGGDSWSGEPSDSHWREQLDLAEEELQQGFSD